MQRTFSTDTPKKKYCSETCVKLKYHTGRVFIVWLICKLKVVVLSTQQRVFDPWPFVSHLGEYRFSIFFSLLAVRVSASQRDQLNPSSSVLGSGMTPFSSLIESLRTGYAPSTFSQNTKCPIKYLQLVNYAWLMKLLKRILTQVTAWLVLLHWYYYFFTRSESSARCRNSRTKNRTVLQYTIVKTSITVRQITLLQRSTFTHSPPIASPAHEGSAMHDAMMQ